MTPSRWPPRRLAAGVLAGAAALGIWAWLARSGAGPLRLSGRIEGYETDVGARVGGRIEAVTVREGNRVVAGQLLVRLDDEELWALLNGARARVASARRQEEQAAAQIELVEDQIRESRLTVLQSEQDNRGRIEQARANVATAEAQLEQALAELKLARVTVARSERLMQEGATAQQTLDRDRTAAESAQAKVTALRRQVEAARGGLALAESTTLNPSIRNAQLAALGQQRRRAEAQLQGSRADVRSALAVEQQIRAQLAWLTIRAPISGVVIARSVEPGAVVVPGRTLLTLLDPKTVYLRGFIPEGDIGRVRLGQRARLFLDSDPKRPLAARVAEIDPQASFTPENIYFQRDRVRQVFGVKLAIDDPAGYAKPGMPADAELVGP